MAISAPIPRRPTGCSIRDTRFLSRLELLVNDVPPLLLGSNLRDDNASLAVDLTNPESDVQPADRAGKGHLAYLAHFFPLAGHRLPANRPAQLRREGDRTCECRSCFANDFADLFEVRGTRRQRRGTQTSQQRGNDQVLLNYHGLDGKLRRTTLTFDPAPDQLDDRCRYLRAASCFPARRVRYLWRPAAAKARTVRRASFARSSPRGAKLRDTSRGRTSVETSNDLFNEMPVPFGRRS